MGLECVLQVIVCSLVVRWFGIEAQEGEHRLHFHLQPWTSGIQSPSSFCWKYISVLRGVLTLFRTFLAGIREKRSCKWSRLRHIFLCTICLQQHRARAGTLACAGWVAQSDGKAFKLFYKGGLIKRAVSRLITGASVSSSNHKDGLKRSQHIYCCLQSLVFHLFLGADDVSVKGLFHRTLHGKT